MPTRRWLVMLLAVVCGVAPIACRRYNVVPPQQPAQPTRQNQPELSNPGPIELLPPPRDPESELPTLQIPARLRNPWKPKVKERNWQHIVLHHTATSRGNVESIHEAHLRRRDKKGNPWLGIGYHFVIGNGNGMTDGAIEPTFRWREQMHGAHAGAGNYNRTGIGIVLVGNFEKKQPTTAQLAAVKKLVQTLKLAYQIDSRNIIGHSDIKATACPGKYFSVTELTLGLPDAGFVARPFHNNAPRLAEFHRNLTP